MMQERVEIASMLLTRELLSSLHTAHSQHTQRSQHETVYTTGWTTCTEVWSPRGLPKKRNSRNPRNPVTVTKSTVQSIVPIYKKGDKKDPLNYRPMSYKHYM